MVKSMEAISTQMHSWTKPKNLKTQKVTYFVVSGYKWKLNIIEFEDKLPQTINCSLFCVHHGQLDVEI